MPCQNKKKIRSSFGISDILSCWLKNFTLLALPNDSEWNNRSCPVRSARWNGYWVYAFLSGALAVRELLEAAQRCWTTPDP